PGALARGVGRIDGNDDASGGRDAVAGQGPLPPRIGEDRHPLAALYAQLGQSERDLNDGLDRVAVCQLAPLALNLVTDRSAVGETLGRRGGKRGDGGRG